MKANDNILFYDHGGLWNAVVINVNKKSVEVLVDQRFCHITDPAIHFIGKNIAVISKERVTSVNGKNIASTEGARISKSVANAMALFGY